MTKIKICGITNIEDALNAIEAGADALGFVFYKPSPRYISYEDAAKIIKQLPVFVTTVGLCVNASAEEVKKVVATGVNLLQFQGDEAADFCQQFALPYIKAIRVASKEAMQTLMATHQRAKAFLLDAHDPHYYGGTGKTFDWQLIPYEMRNHIILAGGLTADNITEAIELIRPFAIDVSGGVEQVKGKKSAHKMNVFCAKVKSC